MERRKTQKKLRKRIRNRKAGIRNTKIYPLGIPGEKRKEERKYS